MLAQTFHELLSRDHEISVLYAAARRLGQDKQYLTVREILSAAETLADSALSSERSNFYQFGYGTLGFTFIINMLL